jgi:uncharacterized protein (DUF58 family)
MGADSREGEPRAAGRASPTTRLVWLTALVVVPGLTGVTAGFPALGAAAAALAALVAALDWWGSRRALEQVGVELPAVVRAGRGKVATVALALAHPPAGAPRRLRIGIPFDPALDPGGPTREVAPVAGKPATALDWEVRGLRRGRFPVGAVYVEAPSPLGLWVRRVRLPAAMEMRVYPDLGAERRRLSAVFLHRGGGGTHAVRQVGKGREFEQLRDYSRGDDYGDIFWRGTAKRGAPLTKVFQLEKTQEVYVVIDHSRLTARQVGADSPGLAQPEDLLGKPPAGDGGAGAAGGVEALTSLDRFLSASLALGLVAESRGDHIGVVTFADQVDGFIRAKNGKGHYDACRDALYALAPEEVSPDFEELVVFLRTRLTRRALLVVLTDLSDAMTAEGFIDHLPLLTRQHLVMVVGLRPEAARPLFSDPDAGSVADVYRALSGQFVWEELLEVGRKVEKLGAHFLVPERDALTSEMVGRYLAIKSRQLL